MTREEKELALYCLKANSDYHSEVCEECTKYPNCDHTGQDDVTETIIKALEQEPILDEIKIEIVPKEVIVKLDETYGVTRSGLEIEIIDKNKVESEDKGW